MSLAQTSATSMEPKLEFTEEAIAEFEEILKCLQMILIKYKDDIHANAPLPQEVVIILKQNSSKGEDLLNEISDAMEKKHKKQKIGHGIDNAKSISPTMILEGLGKVNWAGAGLDMISFALSSIYSRVEGMSENVKNAFTILQGLDELGKYVVRLLHIGHSEGNYDMLKETISLICGGVIWCDKLLQTGTVKSETVCSTMEKEKDIIWERYPVEGLTYSDSEKLFSQHLGECPSARRKQVPGILEICGGLPLALDLVGKHLSQEAVKNDHRSWISAIDGLRKCQFDKGEKANQLNAVVRWSYDRLSDQTKQVFLDICLLFRNKKWKWAELVATGSELKCLTDYSLVKKKVPPWGENRDATIEIHDLLAALGRSGSNSTSKTRVSIQDRESIRKFRQDGQQVRRTIEGFSLRCGYDFNDGDFNNLSKLELSAEELDSMYESLRILIVKVKLMHRGAFKIRETCQNIPPHLQICWIQDEPEDEPDYISVFPYTNISSMEYLRVLRIGLCRLEGLDLEEVQVH